MDKISYRKILGFCGACIAFYIGAGFATMQEVMQYEASYGSSFWIVIVVAAIIYVYTNLSFISNGHRLKLSRGGDIYRAYCGKYIGIIFDWFSAIFCYMSYVVMCGGANSTAMEQWHFPNGVGAVLLTIMVVGTVVLGLNGIVRTLKIIGPIIILFIIIVASTTAIFGWNNFNAGLDAVDSGIYEIVQVGDGNPFKSGISYGGFVILWFAAFLGEIGSKHHVREVNYGMLLSTLAIFGVAAICCVALIANIDSTWNVGVPALVLARTIHPLIAVVFSVIIYLGIYTSATPLLWTGIRKFTDDGGVKYKWIVVVAGGIGCLIACYVPYRPLLNVLYGMNGYLGFILVAFMIVNDIKVLKRKKK